MHASQQRAHATSERGWARLDPEASGTGHRLGLCSAGGRFLYPRISSSKATGHAEDTPSPLDRTLAGAMTDDSFDVGGVASVWDGEHQRDGK